jgi:hypothetical protein
MQGNQVHFVGADDAHGAPIMLKAESEGITPEELVSREVELLRELYHAMACYLDDGSGSYCLRDRIYKCREAYEAVFPAAPSLSPR